MSTPAYVRLQTPAIGWLTFCRVYVASDHLLVVDCSGFEERYRRFLFADVQAILVRYTVVGRVCNLLLGMVGGFAFLGGLVAGGGGFIALGGLSGLLFGLLLINVLRGPTCSVTLKTRVQCHRIKAFNRLKGTRRCVAELIPLIQQSQRPWVKTPASAVDPGAAGATPFPEAFPSADQGRKPDASN